MVVIKWNGRLAGNGDSRLSLEGGGTEMKRKQRYEVLLEMEEDAERDNKGEKKRRRFEGLRDLKCITGARNASII